MRDYSFGNFISAMRERTGLSQYQLGALVGVTDKAVSKWENGVSKPRIGIIRKLSEVLDVGVDELLTCEYDTFNKDRKDLFAMRNEILDVAKKKLKELYGDNPPMRIKNRFKTEELMLNGQDSLLWMGFLGELQDVFYKEKAYFEVRGAQMGASFIAWVLGGTNVNPLPAHYYCPACKKVEFVPNVNCGIDLPDKMCCCGERYHKDGFGIDAANMYPFSKWNELYVSSNGTELVKQCMQEYFKGYGELREIEINYDGIEVSFSYEVKTTRIGVFSKEVNKRYPEGKIVLCPEEFSLLLQEVSAVTIIENIEEPMDMQEISNTELTAQHVIDYFNYAVANNVFDEKVYNVNVKKLLSDMKSPSFSELLTVYGFLHSTGAWEENAELLYDKGVPLTAMISCREDVYAYLYSKLQGKCCENPSGLVFEIKEAVRKGRYRNWGMPEEIENLLLECDIPEWYVESMKKIMYLFPKAHLVVLLKRDICNFVRMNKE